MADSIGRGILITLACVSAAIAAACASAAPNTLAGTSWTVASVNGQPTSGPRTPTLVFDSQNRVNGNGGCNSYFGEYSAHDGAIDLSGVGRTEMACMPQSIMAQEDAYLGALDAATR